MRIFLRQDCAGGDELFFYGAVPFFICDAGAAAVPDYASSWVEPAGVGMAGVGFVSGRAIAVSDSVLCAVDYDGEPCCANGGDHAGDSRGRGYGVGSRANGPRGLDGAGGIDVWSGTDCAGRRGAGKGWGDTGGRFTSGGIASDCAVLDFDQ